MTQLALLSLGGGLVAYFVVKLLFARDTAVEGRRLESLDLSDACTKNGLPIMGKVLKRYAIGDYSGLAFAVREVRDIVSDPEELQAVVDRFLGIQLDKKLKTVEGRNELITAIEDRLGIEIPRDIIRELPKRKLVTEDQVAEEVDLAVEAILTPPKQV